MRTIFVIALFALLSVITYAAEPDYKFKLVIVGDAASGKSSILSRYVDNTFTDSYIATIGLDFKIKSFDISGKSVRLQIWDTAGQDRFRSIVPSSYKGANAIIMVYDVTNKWSFNKLQTLYKEVWTYASRDAKLMIVGNKMDLEDKRQISYNAGKMVADAIKADFFEVSAKSGINVDKLFSSISVDLIKAQQ